MRRAGEDFVIVDGRTFAEYHKMNIPGGICCPNGELALRIGDIVPDPKTKIVVNCAGRTRSIIGAQTLIDFGVAQSGGGAGERHAGLDAGRARARERRQPAPWRRDHAPPTSRPARPARARWPRRTASRSSRPPQAKAWLADASRTTYLLDVRTPEEFAASAVPGFAHAPGGQLVQATDQWVGVKGARLVLLDEEGVRAPVIAGWLRQLGHEACVLEGGVAAAAQVAWPRSHVAPGSASACGDDAARAGGRAAPGHGAGHRPAPGHDLPQGPHRAGALVDPAADREGRRGHAPRPSCSSPTSRASRRSPRSISPKPAAAMSACSTGGHEAWRAAGLPVVATPDDPPDADCIDFLFFTHGRHEGNAEAARQYLAWEIGLIDQLDAQERGAFRLTRMGATRGSACRRRSTADALRYFALMLERLTWSRFLPSMRISFTGASRLGECTSPTS